MESNHQQSLLLGGVRQPAQPLVWCLFRTWCNASGGCGKDSQQKDVVGGQCQLFTTKNSGPAVYASGDTQPYISGFLAHP